MKETENLTDWKNPPTLSDLTANLDESKSAHQAHTSEVDGWMSSLRGEQKVKRKVGRSKIVPKVIRKQAEWRYSSLSEPFLSTSDLFNVAPNTFEDKKSAIQNAQVLNYQFNHQINKVKFIDEYVRAPTDEGSVLVKIGWTVREAEMDVEVEDVKVVLNQETLVYEEVVVGSHIERKTTMVKNQPILTICDYKNTVIDPTCGGDIDIAEFIIDPFETSKSDLRKDGRYKNIDDIVIETSDSQTDSEFNNSDDSSFRFADDPRKKFIVYEYHGYWDINGNGVTEPIVAAWAGLTMIRLEKAPFPDKKLPFVLVHLLPRRKNVYGEPDGALIEDNQKVIGAVTRGMLDILGRSANGQTGTRKDALDRVNARKYERGDDYKFNSNIDPKQAFHMGVYPEIPRSAIELITMQSNEAESLTGVKAFNSGITGNALGDSVGGIRSALDATAKRELGILRRLANGVIQIGRKIISMNQEFLDDETILRITDDEFVTISRDDLAGEFDITLSISTPEADAAKAQGLEFMLQTMGNSLPFEFSQIILADIARLKKMPELSKRIEEYQVQPDPLEEKRAQLEIALLEAQVFNEQAKGQENAVDVKLKSAKTETEIAKARGLHSSSDKQDLDFIEQESGVNRQHEINVEDNKSRNKNESTILEATVGEEQR